MNNFMIRRFVLIAKLNHWHADDEISDFIATLEQQGEKGTKHITHISKKEVEEFQWLGYKLQDLGCETYEDIKELENE